MPMYNNTLHINLRATPFLLDSELSQRKCPNTASIQHSAPPLSGEAHRQSSR